ncbi:MAG TPA: VOC family protein [Candidatus Polarisedimenticolia bacterium]|jgi:catechol 2,3-dioxygenase-like lactoylglutathione lyase family enzyme|nr:VOC family protein [Candidatus Polarisedimenticolia bacterium]
MIDHITLNVKDAKKSRQFFTEALAPLGYQVVMEYPGGVGFGIGGKPDFWIRKRTPSAGGTHVAFTSKERSKVDAFYGAAIKAGGKDNGKPGIREHYHPSYYGAFVLDPDGNNIEAVCHEAVD